MMIMLGNLSIEEMEIKSGVKFTDELKLFMGTRKQESAKNVEKGKWHCFDIPFHLVCGDMDTAVEIHGHLSDFSEDFKERMDISINDNN